MNPQEIKSSLSMLAVLDHYGITSLRQKDQQLSGTCPIHNGDNPNAFHINLEKNLWHCFTRDHGGDVFSFIMQYEQVSFAQALEIAKNILNNSEKQFIPHERIIQRPESSKANPPLKFALKLDQGNPYLEQRGISKETAEHFGIGFCNRGILKGRIAIPIHDEKGKLIAYAGRSITNEKPKYKFPRGFNKSLVLFNLHRAKQLETDNLIIVEGFFDCFKIHQAGFPNLVALMGCIASKEQINLLIQQKKKLLLVLDGDQAGRAGTEKLVQALRGKLPLVVKYLPDMVQPDQLSVIGLQNLLNERSLKCQVTE